MQCPVCQHEHRDDLRFCGSCAARVGLGFLILRGKLRLACSLGKRDAKASAFLGLSRWVGVVALTAACAHRVPPPPVDMAPAALAPAARLSATVQALSGARTNRGRLRVVKQRVEELGLDYTTEPIDWFSLQRNVLIELPGRRPELVYVVAHYDKMDMSPLKLVSLLLNGALDELVGLTFTSEGAVDNATGVAVALELAAALAETERGYTYRVLLVGSEESGLRGSRAHVARLGHGDRERIALGVNIDSVGAVFASNCVYEDVSDPDYVRHLLDVAARRGIPLESGSMPLIGSSDYAPFRRSGPLVDVGRGLKFNLVGGLLPQRSWFQARHAAPVLSLGACNLLGPADVMATVALLPVARIHSFRDHAGKVDPRRLYECWAVLLAFFDEMEAAAAN